MASTGEVWRLGHRPELDGVRGIAVALVVVTHVGIPHMRAAGVVGVTVFFTLSGFLITSLLLEEFRDRGRIDLRAFYYRRALRLLPAVLVMLGVLGAAFVVVGHTLGWVWGQAQPVILYYGNWVRVDGEYLGLWSHAWSLAVEEQFYLVWPFLLILVVRWGREAIVAVCGVGIVYSIAARVVAWDGGEGLNRVYYGSDMHADALLAGALLAAFMRGRRDGRSNSRVAAVLLVLIGSWSVAGNGFAIFGVGLAVVPILTVALLLAVARGDGVGWLSWSPLVTVGQRSYGLYLWHYPLTYPLLFVPGAWHWPAVAVVVAASWGATCLSWRYVEQPLLRLKDRREGSAVDLDLELLHVQLGADSHGGRGA